ncbi:hypothetical protein BHM03_00044304 [Ensete ventricosum]|nr:hypothetical protein BHM03_00044304 [Ensete ventricosum]
MIDLTGDEDRLGMIKSKHDTIQLACVGSSRESLASWGVEGGCTEVFNECDAFGWDVGMTLHRVALSIVLGVSFGEAADREYGSLSDRHGS